MPFWQFFRKGWDGRALLVRPSKTHHRIWKIIFVLSAHEYLERLEGKIRKYLSCFVKIFKNNSVSCCFLLVVLWRKGMQSFKCWPLSFTWMLIDKCQTKLISKSREYIADFQGGKGGPIGTIKILVLKVYRQFLLKLTYIF